MSKQIKKQIVAVQKQRDAKGHFIKQSKKYSASPWIADDPDPFEVASLPPGVAPFAPDLKHVNVFRGLAMAGTKTYRNLDEALRNSRVNAKAMRHDLVIMEPLLAREITLAQLEDHIEPEDAHDEYQKHVAEEITKILKDTPRWTEYKRNLAECLWYGKMAIVNNYKFDYETGHRRMKIDNWFPILGEKLIFLNSDKEVGYLIHTATGLREIVYSDIGRAELFTPEDMECVVLHKHMIMDSDYDEPDLAIGIHGVGLRSILYWAWWMKQELLGWLFDVFQRYGAGGIQIWYFEAGNPKSEAAVREAAQSATGQNIILFPKPIGTEKQGASIEILKPEGAGLDYFYKFIDEYFNAQIRRTILGESGDLKSRVSEGGADLIKSDFIRLLKYDAENLEETINKLVKVLVKYNFPDARFRLRYKINVEKPNVEQFLTAAQRLYEMNCALDEDQIRGVVGLSKPDPLLDNVLQKPKGEDQTIRTPEKNIGNLGENLS